jgi:serine/threonine protein kinase
MRCIRLLLCCPLCLNVCLFAVYGASLSSFVVNGQVQRTSEQPVAQGEFNDVYTGTQSWRAQVFRHRDSCVLLARNMAGRGESRTQNLEAYQQLGKRTAREHPSSRQSYTLIGNDQKFRREVDIWRSLNHRNVVRFYGIVKAYGKLYTVMILRFVGLR